MQKIPSSEEQQLSKLTPAALDDGFLARLTASAEGTAAQLSPEEMDFDASLRRMKPRNVPSALSASLLETLSTAPFAVDEKIVLFNGKSRTGTTSKKSNIFRFNIAAAAAVALLGSIAAFMVPQNGGDAPIIAGNSSSTSLEEVGVPYVPPMDNINLSTASFDTPLDEASDEVVIWSYPMQPQRIMRPTFFDENEGANNSNTKQLHRQYGLIPVSND
jgi:anti-sigma-K factor RskA